MLQTCLDWPDQLHLTSTEARKDLETAFTDVLLDCLPSTPSSASQADLQRATAEKRTSPLSRSVNCLQILAEPFNSKSSELLP